jgi:hypothetical protein
MVPASIVLYLAVPLCARESGGTADALDLGFVLRLVRRVSAGLKHHKSKLFRVLDCGIMTFRPLRTRRNANITPMLKEVSMVNALVNRQSTMMAYNDSFWLVVPMFLTGKREPTFKKLVKIGVPS